MRLTNRAKAVGVTILSVITVTILSYANYTTAKQVEKLTNQKPAIMTKYVIVTPTQIATPTATLKTQELPQRVSPTKVLTK